MLCRRVKQSPKAARDGTKAVCMLNTLNKETISPNSFTQAKDSGSSQGRGLCHRWQRPKTDEMKWAWKMMIRNGMDQETQQQVGYVLQRKADTESTCI